MSVDATSNQLDEFWRSLVTVALLGTDRRDPPTPPPGPLADLTADAVRSDGASRLLAMVAATAAARRAGFVPAPAATPLQPPPSDERPMCTPAAMGTWRTIVAEWPVLEDEWVLTAIQQGLRLPPDGVGELLLRHRNDATRRARAALAAGPIAEWLDDHVPAVASAGRRTASAGAVGTLPELPVPVELADLLTADARTFCRRLAAGFQSGFGPAHKAVLVNLLARCRPAVLTDAARTLDAQHVGLAVALADLARLRHRMLTELGVTP